MLAHSVDIEPGLYDILLDYKLDQASSDSICLILDSDTLAVFKNLQFVNGADYQQIQLVDIIISANNCSVLQTYFGNIPGKVDKLEFVKTSEIPLLDITIVNCPEVGIIQGFDYAMELEFYPSDAANQSVIWSSSDTNVITVDSIGTVQAKVDSGSTYIIAISEDGGHIDSCYFTIDARKQTSYNYELLQIPGLIQAEDYDLGLNGKAYYDVTNQDQNCNDRVDDVDMQTSSNDDGTCNIGWTEVGEWTEYSVYIDPGVYEIRARLASQQTCKIKIELDGEELNIFTVPASSNGWQVWATDTVRNVSLPGGEHLLRVTIHSGNLNINYFEFVKTAECMCEEPNGIAGENLWIGPKVGDWMASPCNWSKGCFPVSDEDVKVATGYSLTIRSGESVYINSLEVESGGVLLVEEDALFSVNEG